MCLRKCEGENRRSSESQPRGRTPPGRRSWRKGCAAWRRRHGARLLRGGEPEPLLGHHRTRRRRRRSRAAVSYGAVGLGQRAHESLSLPVEVPNTADPPTTRSSNLSSPLVC